VTLESNRMMGGIGALLIVISSLTSFASLAQFFFPNVVLSVFTAPVGVLGFAGLILFMVAMNGLANHYKDRGIFENALYWIITAIVGGVVTAVFAVVMVFSVLSSVVGTLTPLTPGTAPTASAVLEAFQPYIGYLIPIIVVALAVGVISALFIMKAFNKLAHASGVQLFRTAGLLFLVSVVVGFALMLLAALLIFAGSIAVTAIVPLASVSGLISVATWALATTGFFRLRPTATPPVPQTTMQATALASGQVKYCPHCGAENRMDAVFCVRCGEKLQA
jgi:uncharacterized membrane protein